MRVRVLLAILLVLFQGCVGVIVQSVPMGASVYVDGQLIGQTPCKFKAKTIVGCEYEVVVKKEGYADFRETVETEWDPGSLFLILSPLIILTPFLGNVVPRVVFAPLEVTGR